METKKSLALLCDYGLDDAIATLYLLKNSHFFDKIDILPIGGNFPLKQAMKNAKRLLTYVEELPENVRIVDTSSVKQTEEYLPDIHGNDGMGDVLPDSYEEKTATVSYEDWLLDVDENYIVVSLGPCAVTLDIFKNKGALPLIMMAGNIAEAPNYNGYEFNHGLDTYSFSECVKYPHLVATLDTCHCKPCNLKEKTFNRNDLLSKMIKRYIDLSVERKEPACYVYDLTAAVYLTHPERFTHTKATDKDDNVLSVLKYISDKPIIE